VIDPACLIYALSEELYLSSMLSIVGEASAVGEDISGIMTGHCCTIVGGGGGQEVVHFGPE